MTSKEEEAEETSRDLWDKESFSATYALQKTQGARRWFTGSKPRTAEDFIRELDLTADYWRKRVEEAKPRWLIGKPPETPEELEQEARFRELDRRWSVEADDRRHRADLEFEAVRVGRRGESVRATVLISVVAAVVAYPLIAMLSGESAADFSQFIAPITGIAGTVIGYWFGQRGQQTTTAPAGAATPPMASSESSASPAI